MATPKAHVGEKRKTKFSIGWEEANPLTEDLHQAVKNLSAEPYAKDVHFLMELIHAIAISSDTKFVTRKNIDVESYTLHLSAKENGYEFDKECGYYMLKQKFPVRLDCRMDGRNDVVDEWVITLAFPIAELFHRGTNTSPGVYMHSFPPRWCQKFVNNNC
ncbi:hypothetical protein TB2_038045 [Malus domestica]